MHFSIKTLLSGALAGLWLATPATAQTTVSIPATASVVGTTLHAIVNNDIWWVCGSGSLTLQGNNNTVFSEPGARLVVNGNGNVVYSRSRASLTVAGNNNTVYNGGAASVTVTGNSNVAHSPASGKVTFTGQNNTRLPLTSLAFSYANTSGAGCRPTATAEEIATAEALTLAPNPVGAADGLMTLTSAATPLSARVYDGSGRLVRAWEAPATILDLRGLSRGLYVVQVALPTTTVTRRVVVE